MTGGTALAGGAFDHLELIQRLIDNLLALRNTSFGNLIDGCSVSLPLTDTPGAGLMLTAARGRDAALLTLAETLAGRL